MNLGTVIDRLATFLAGKVGLPAASVGGAVPALASELPALALSMTGVTQARAGVGNRPRPTQRQALRIAVELDVAAPFVVDGETVPLISDGGRVLILPTGPLVRPSGDDPPLAAGELVITIDGHAVDFATGTPGPGEFAIDPAAATTLGFGDPDRAGVVRFGTPLTTGTLRAVYHVGQWDLTATRFRGELRVDVFAASAAAVDTLSRGVADALAGSPDAGPGRFYELTPSSWGPIAAAPAPLTAARTRALTYRLDYELEEPLIRTAGALISRVKVHTLPPDQDFDVT